MQDIMDHETSAIPNPNNNNNANNNKTRRINNLISFQYVVENILVDDEIGNGINNNNQDHNNNNNNYNWLDLSCGKKLTSHLRAKSAADVNQNSFGHQWMRVGNDHQLR
jgi:hypothetical protein